MHIFVFYGKMITYTERGAGFPNRNPIYFLRKHGKLQKYAIELLKFNKSSADAAYSHLTALL